jgi:hypothetical protein
MSDDTGNGWGEYRKLVMTEIDRLAREIRHERNNASKCSSISGTKCYVLRKRSPR